jgi:hypothetical protein
MAWPLVSSGQSEYVLDALVEDNAVRHAAFHVSNFKNRYTQFYSNSVVFWTTWKGVIGCKIDRKIEEVRMGS